MEEEKKSSILEVKKEERSYQFHCSPNSPLGEIYDALSQMRAYVINRMVEEQNAEQPPEEKEGE